MRIIPTLSIHVQISHFSAWIQDTPILIANTELFILGNPIEMRWGKLFMKINQIFGVLFLSMLSFIYLLSVRKMRQCSNQFKLYCEYDFIWVHCYFEFLLSLVNPLSLVSHLTVGCRSDAHTHTQNKDMKLKYNIQHHSLVFIHRAQKWIFFAHPRIPKMNVIPDEDPLQTSTIILYF